MQVSPGNPAAALARMTGKTRRQLEACDKLLALGGIWEINKGKGKAVTPPPHWIWEGLATHAPAAAQLACEAADLASAAKYFEVILPQYIPVPCTTCFTLSMSQPTSMLKAVAAAKYLGMWC